MNLAILTAELTDDPLSRGYAAMSDAAAATDLNAVYRTRNKSSMTGSEILNAVNAGEWTALNDVQRQTVWNILHLGTLNPFGVEATLMIAVFEAGSATITALADARKENISRAAELGLGFVSPGHVENARY